MPWYTLFISSPYLYRTMKVVCQTIPDVVFEILSSLLSVKVQGLHLE